VASDAGPGGTAGSGLVDASGPGTGGAPADAGLADGALQPPVLTPPDAAPPAPGPTIVAGAGTWQVADSLPGGARQEVGVVALGSRVFVIGGQGPNGAKVEAFDTVTGKWEAHANLPFVVDHPNVAAVGDKLYLLGGTQTARVFEYTPGAPAAQRRWLERRTMPTARAAAATAAIGTKVYVAGGQRGGDSFRTLEAYDTATDTWDTSLPPLPGPGRNHVPGAAVDGIFYVIGGRTGGPATGLQSRVDAFDPATGRWSTRAPMPTARGGAGAGVVGGFIVVVGGEGNSARGSQGVFPQVEAYDPAANRWLALPAMRSPRHGMGAAGIGNKLYVPAGALRQGGGSQVPIMEVLVF
jgi:N-acetylneuraminic acid mutarotase